MARAARRNHVRLALTLVFALLTAGCVTAPEAPASDARGAVSIAIGQPVDVLHQSARVMLSNDSPWVATLVHVPADAWAPRSPGGHTMRLEAKGDALPDLVGTTAVFQLEGDRLLEPYILDGLEWSLSTTAPSPRNLRFVVLFAAEGLTGKHTIHLGVPGEDGALAANATGDGWLASGRHAAISLLRLSDGTDVRHGVTVKDERTDTAVPSTNGPGRLTIEAERAGPESVHFAHIVTSSRTPRMGTWSITSAVDGEETRREGAFDGGANAFGNGVTRGSNATVTWVIDLRTPDVRPSFTFEMISVDWPEFTTRYRLDAGIFAP